MNQMRFVEEISCQGLGASYDRAYRRGMCKIFGVWAKNNLNGPTKWEITDHKLMITFASDADLVVVKLTFPTIFGATGL